MRSGETLVRIHRLGNGPWWYSQSGAGRFDLVGLDCLGTCYLAEAELAGFVEVFRDTNPIPASEVATRGVSAYVANSDITLADCTRREARRFGVTGAIHSTEDYAKTQAWAAALHAAGFGGIRYFVSHDPAQALIGVALFGQTQPDAGSPQPIAESTIDAAESAFGLRVLPTAQTTT